MIFSFFSFFPKGKSLDSHKLAGKCRRDCRCGNVWQPLPTCLPVPLHQIVELNYFGVWRGDAWRGVWPTPHRQTAVNTPAGKPVRFWATNVTVNATSHSFKQWKRQDSGWQGPCRRAEGWGGEREGRAEEPDLRCWSPTAALGRFSMQIGTSAFQEPEASSGRIHERLFLVGSPVQVGACLLLEYATRY